jgi:putative ABC transport system ATP-binding protein
MVLDGIDAEFPAGCIHVVAGPTGAGKSSLIHVLGGLLRPTRGEVFADGEPVSRWISAHKDLWRRNVGIVFQHSRLLSNITALENIMLPLIPRGLDIHGLRSRTINALDRLAATGLAGRAVTSLSGGERQIVAIARAVACSPRFFLADEPTAHQDNQSLERILRLLDELKNEQATVLVTTHDVRLEQAFPCERLFRIADGRLTR